MNQTIYVNEKHGVKVTITESEYFGIQARIEKDGILGYEGEVSREFVGKMIDKLDLTA